MSNTRLDTTATKSQGVKGDIETIKQTFPVRTDEDDDVTNMNSLLHSDEVKVLGFLDQEVDSDDYADLE
eukprot:CAMPEP_0203663694 /NCGR_PEP_ID=MMETSP0090-20130426/1239_1 /ASSEMBLY_ACC=CAM_ASM_001088 /TAXON_ID=426623 /ORGANISM="Chaetoceros affinis, Strain CCMP159" /LENGTH=68 /DNA_ID=CAMNT_0050526685 /DNA_START=149 /DNA_END=355 /DNA_ORIENTATION=+